jgi:hypothetical protein
MKNKEQMLKEIEILKKKIKQLELLIAIENLFNL